MVHIFVYMVRIMSSVNDLTISHPITAHIDIVPI